MQTTLLATAIAIILALVAALVAPLLIDWSTYRALIEREASRIAGAEVRVDGTIDARLLPSPQLTLRNIVIGGDRPEAVRAGALDIEFALSPLMSGEWRASELRVTAPQLTLGLDASGKLKGPTLTPGFDPDSVSVERLSIVNGKVTLADAASGTSVVLERVYFNGQATSLLGPLRGEGDVVIAGSHYPYRISASRYDDAGDLKLRLNVDPRDHPLNFQADGALTFDGGPRFKGTLALTRAAGIAASGAGQLKLPWQLRSKVDAGAASALLEDVDFQYGTEELGLRLTGVADFRFGQQPRFKAELTGRQINLDRVLTDADGARTSPATALRKLAELAAGAAHPGFPVEIGLGVDQVTLAGNAVQTVRGDIVAEDGGWNLKSFEFRAPGFTQARLSGHLAIAGDAVTFTGPAEIDSNDPRALTAWLEGRETQTQSDPRRLRLRGEVTVGSERIAVERLAAEFARKTVNGRFAYVFATREKPSRLEAALNAPELDLDVALGFGKALLAGSQLARPREMAIDAAIGLARIGGIEGRDINARVKVDADQWEISRLSVADLGGAAFSASGRILLGDRSPEGSMRVDFDATDLVPITTLLSRYAPKTAQALSIRADQMAPAKLHAQLTAARGAPAKLVIEGSLGKTRLALNGEGEADLKEFRLGQIKLNGKLAADDGRAVIALLGLNSLIAVDAGPGALALNVEGPADGAMRVDARLTAAGLDAAAAGDMRPFADNPTATLRATIARADFAPLRPAGASRPPLLVTFAGRIALSPAAIAVSDGTATVAGSGLRGKLTAGLTAPHRIEGDIEADSAQAPALIAAAIGMPAPAPARGQEWAWPVRPFGDGAFGDLTGKVSVRVRSLDLMPQIAVRAFRANVNLGKGTLSIGDMNGIVSGGRLTGLLAFTSDDSGLKARTQIALAGADAASLLRAAARPPVTGALDLSFDAEGGGLSPVALIGSLRGSGKIALRDGELAGLDPRAFDAVTRAVDQGLPVENDRIATMVRRALDSGQLPVKHVQGTIAIAAGQVRLGDVAAETRNASLSLGGSLDLIDGSLDVRLVLSGKNKEGGDSPDIFMSLRGPVAAPAQSIDISALSGWLTLRSIDNQARRVRELEEAARREREAEEKRRATERQRREEEARRQAEIDRLRQEGERLRLQEEQARREEELRRKDEAERRRRETARQSAPATNLGPVFMPPTGLAPVRAPDGGQAPALPPPIEIHPAPRAAGVPPTPEASVGAQR